MGSDPSGTSINSPSANAALARIGYRDSVRLIRRHPQGRPRMVVCAIEQGGAPLGGLLAGWLTAVGGTRLAFLIGGTIPLGMAALGVARLSR